MALELPLPKDSDVPGDVVERLRSLPAINIYRMLGHATGALKKLPPLKID
jgi:hypothetical protein